MKRLLRKLPVFIMAIALIIILTMLGGLYFSEKKQTVEIEKYRKGFTLVCPELSRCGDAFLLYDDDEAVMIDTGESADADVLLDLLKERGVESLDALILTHYDKDHIGGASAVLEAVPVEKCYTTCGTEDSDEYLELMRSLKKTGTRQVVVTEPESFQVLGADFTIYPPLTSEFEKDQDNNLSLITSVDAPEDKLLFTGDAEKERMTQYMENQYDGTQYTWLKVPHHGRDKSTVKMLLNKFIPADAVICSSEDEPEEKKVVKLLKKEDVNVWLTREDTAEFKISTIEEEEDSEEKTDKESKNELNTESDSDSKKDKETYGEAASQVVDETTGQAADEASSQADDEAASQAVDETDTKSGNEKAGAPSSKVKAPVFSRESGFYKKPFSLKIEADKDVKVYYTLDCSEPTTTSSKYSKSIKIEDATSKPNNLSARTDLQPYRYQTTSRYYTKITDGWFSRNIPPENVDKCQVVRAIAVDKEGNKSDVVTASYFIGYENKKGYHDIPVLSLVSDPEDLTNEDTGILVNGSTYNTKWKNGELDGILDTHDLRQYCNTYKYRGRESERKVHMDYFSKDHDKLIFSQEAGIRLHGNQSRVTQSQKSFNLYARKSYDGNSTFLIPFFGDGLLSDKVVLMRGNDVRNYFLSEKMNNRIMKTQKYSMVQVFLDGEYWGIYAIQEKYNSEEYLKSRYNLGDGDYILAKGTPVGLRIKKGDPEAIRTSFKLLRDFAANNDLSIDENYQQLSSMMDIQSFIDGYAARLYVSDQDWTWYKNQYLLFYDQKWHWMVFDMDYGASWYNPAQPTTNTFLTTRLLKSHSLETDPLFPYLKKNPEFCRQFVNTFLDLGNEVYEGRKIRKEVNKFNETYKEAGILESERHKTDISIEAQGDPTYISSMYQMAEKMATFFEQRLQYASGYAADYFGLTGEAVTVTIENENPEGGEIKLNTITPTLKKDQTWSGIYYTDYPVTLEAKPKEGYEFAGWKTTKTGTLTDAKSPQTDLSFTGDVKIKATFKKIK